MKALNKAQVSALFEQEAILMGTEDCVPEYRAAELFGKEAVAHAMNLSRANPGRYVNGYGVADYTLIALTFRGFQAAASFHNVQVLEKEARHD